MNLRPSSLACAIPVLFLSAGLQAQVVLDPIGPLPPGAVPTEPVTIRKIQYNGSGCPLGSVAENISPDKRAFTLTFSQFVAEMGPDLPLASGRKNCEATIVLNVPSGWQYSIGTFFYRGYVEVDEGVEAEHSVNYSFEGQGKTGQFSNKQVGPFAQDYVYSDQVDLTANVWSPCGEQRALNLNAKIRVSNIDATAHPIARGFMTNDSIDGEVTQVFGITWRPCK